MEYNYEIPLIELLKEHYLSTGEKFTLRDVEVGSGLSYVTLQNIRKNGGAYSSRSLNLLCSFFQRPVQEVLRHVPRDEYS